MRTGRWSLAIGREPLVTLGQEVLNQTLGDTYGDYFDGDEVLEASGYRGANNCWYVGAPFDNWTTVNGSHWYVAQNDAKNLGIVNGHNQWGIDLDGNITGLIALIRSHAVLPCTDYIPRTMYIYVSSCISYPYYSNVQTVTISAKQVVNCRGGVCDTITY
jgi:hypothetical protein